MPLTFKSIKEAKDACIAGAAEDNENWYVTYGPLNDKPDLEDKSDYWWALEGPVMNLATTRPALKQNAFCYYTPKGVEVRLDGQENGNREIVLTTEQWSLVKSMLDIKDEEDVLTDVERELKEKLDAEL